ncbi:MAG TPA: DUF2993 domain-containing protein [Jatrophihabitans sp.]|jgi:hypothetical protein|uniref:LmeA family phospholipid-binding protein n=1 Tax=Jatrophihabitans sp. TaxID=1932789 RepID=UPI002E09DE4C|nr:DUF2993 domain-containing protein [Jatrophihabitans sp.]
MATPAPPRPRAPRRLLIGLVVLALVLLAADRIGKYGAERIAGDTIQNSQHLPSRPEVDVAGFPFLTQFAAGDYGEITLTSSDVPVGTGSTALTVTQLRVVLHQVTVSRNFSSFHADSAAANGLIDYTQLGKALGVTLRYAGDGRVHASKTVTVLGRQFTGSITAEPRIVNDSLSFAGVQVDGANSLAQEAVALLTKVFDVSLPLQGLPFHVRVKSVTVAPAGLRIVLTGADLSYSK